jgi:hypothetical protein
LRYCGALGARAEAFDRQAQQLLAAVAGGAVRTPAVRAVLDYANTLRCMAESSRRAGEAYLRKATVSAEREQAKVKSQVPAALGHAHGRPPGIRSCR